MVGVVTLAGHDKEGVVGAWQWKELRESRVGRSVAGVAVLMVFALSACGERSTDSDALPQGDALPETLEAVPSDSGVVSDRLERGEWVVDGWVVDEWISGEYKVQVYRDEELHGSLEVLRNGESVYEEDGWNFYILPTEYVDCGELSRGADITGDGQPNCVVRQWTGGAHCCFHFYIFEVGEEFRLIQRIDALDAGGTAEFRNFDDEPDLEFRMSDMTFRYWRGSFAQSPASQVILKFNGEKYEIAPELMVKRPLSEAELDQLVERVKNSGSVEGYGGVEYEEEWPYPILWDQALDLIYSGNSAQARELVRRTWPEDNDEMEMWVDDLWGRLQMSPYWPGIRKINR